MIDTERAAVDLKTSVSRLRYYLRQMRERTLTREEINLVKMFAFDLNMISGEAKNIRTAAIKGENNGWTLS
jgi:hypothetical protein